MKTEFVKEFLTDTDQSGRFVVTSARTGRRYFVEAIGDPHTNWGSIVPGDNTAKLSVKKGWKKNRGSVDAEDSLITESNGFSKIHDLEPGLSPMAYIDMLDDQYPDKDSV